MIELVKFELKKIFEKKIIYLLALAVAIFIVLPGVSSWGDREEMRKFATEFEGDKYTVEKFQQEMKAVDKKLENQEKLTERENFIRNYMSFSYPRSPEPEYLVGLERYTHSEIKEKFNELEEGTYDYNAFKQANEMISALPQVEYKYTGGWGIMLDFNVAGTMKLILLAIGLAWIFSSEYGDNTAQVLLSTKNGKGKGTIAKIIAGLIYAVIVFVFVSLLYSIGPIMQGLENGDLPLGTITGSASTPYNLTIMEFYFITLGISFLGTITFALAIMFVSLLIKSNMISMAVGLGLYFIPGFFVVLPLPEIVQSIITGLSFAQFIRAASVFEEYVTFNIFGNAVLYPYVLAVAMLIMLISIPVLIYKLGKRQQLC